MTGFLAAVLAVPAPVAAQADIADAAMRGDIDSVRVLIAQSGDVNAPQQDGATPVHWAAYLGDAELARVLIDAGADVTVANRLGVTPLWLAATNGDAGMIRMLMNAGADANEQLPLGRTPLMIAARTGNPEAVGALLDGGADIEARDARVGTTPLMWAADQGHAAAVALLIERGADISARSDPVERIGGGGGGPGKSGDPRTAVRQNVLRILCEQTQAEETSQQTPALTPAVDEAAVEAEGPREDDGPCGSAAIGTGGGRGGREPELDGGQMTALVYAARSNSLETARVLVEAGADVNQTAGYGWSPLLAATHNRNYQLAAYLIEHGADVNLAHNGGWTPLYLATDNRNVEGGDYPTRSADMDHLEYIRLLLDAGADVNARIVASTESRTTFTDQWLNEEGATAFLRASQSGDLVLMRLLLEYGADPHINTTLGVTPLDVAAGIGWVEGIQSEWSAEQTVEAVRLLLDLGIDPNHQADTGRVALHGAAHKGATEVVRVLVEEGGARLDIRDFGNTDARGSAEMAAHTWLPVDYADGLVRVGVQSAIAHPETGLLIRELMEAAGLTPPPMNRTLDSVCIIENCGIPREFLDEFELVAP